MKLPESHPNLSKAINDAIAASEIEGGCWVSDWPGRAEGPYKDAVILPVGRGLRVTTRNTVYTIRKEAEGGKGPSFTIQGHSHYCPVPTPCAIHGSTFGGSMIKVGWVGRGMHLEFYIEGRKDGVITTTQIQEIEEIP